MTPSTTNAAAREVVDLAPNAPRPWRASEHRKDEILDANGDPIGSLYGPDKDRQENMAIIVRAVNALTPQQGGEQEAVGCDNCNGSGVYVDLCGNQSPCQCQAHVIEASRARFEDWMSAGRSGPGRHDRDQGGNYFNDEVAMKWCVWQAADSIAQARISELSDDWTQALEERDHAQDIIDNLCDAVLGPDRREWSSMYFFEDAVAEVEDRMAALTTPPQGEQEAGDAFVVTDAVVDRLCDALWPNNANWQKPLCDTTKPYGEQLRSIVRDALTAALRTKQPAASEGDGKVWRCFLCDETFTDEAEAALHFGTRMEGQAPACTIDVAEYRRMEAQTARYADEDADVHRAMRRQQGEHAAALRRAEEDGYAASLVNDIRKNRGEEPFIARRKKEPTK